MGRKKPGHLSRHIKVQILANPRRIRINEPIAIGTNSRLPYKIIESMKIRNRGIIQGAKIKRTIMG
jgi:hypothetical protein